MMHSLLALFTFSPMEVLVLLGIGVLLFGRKLPDVGRSLGKTIVEFKKGIKGLEDDLDTSHNPQIRYEQPVEAPRPPQKVATTAPKFEDAPAPPAAPTSPPPKV